MSNLEDFEKNIGYKFKNTTFLKIALTNIIEETTLKNDQEYD